MKKSNVLLLCFLQLLAYMPMTLVSSDIEEWEKKQIEIQLGLIKKQQLDTESYQRQRRKISDKRLSISRVTKEICCRRKDKKEMNDEFLRIERDLIEKQEEGIKTDSSLTREEKEIKIKKMLKNKVELKKKKARLKMGRRRNGAF